MAKQIIYGVGKAILRDYRTPTKVIGFADLQNLAVESTASMEDVTGGNKMFPIASFKTDTAVNVSATNACFDPGMLEYLEGATVSTGAATMTGFMEVAIPADGEITLAETPVANSVVVQGFTLGESAEALNAGEYFVSSTTVNFATADAGKVVVIVYEYTSSENTTEYSMTQMSLAKPFVFDYIFDIYDEDSQVSHKAMIKIYKAQCSSGFSLDTSHQSPFAPSFEASAKDPQRVDGKFWSLFIDGVEV